MLEFVLALKSDATLIIIIIIIFFFTNNMNCAAWSDTSFGNLSRVALCLTGLFKVLGEPLDCC